MNNILFCDIETAPGKNKPSPKEIKVPGNYRDPQKILSYQLANIEEAYQKQALDSMAGEIICIGTGLLNEEPKIFRGTTELETLANFNRYINELRGDWAEPIIMAGWNILSFDLPWLWRKAIKHNLRDLRGSIPKDNKHMTVDLMKIWAAEYRDYVSLDACAKFLGIEHEGEGGNEIYGLWLAGDFEAIENHCKRDILTTMEIYKRIYT